MEYQKAKFFYKELKQAKCGALGEYVIFNRAGFQHLIRRDGIQRPKGEQKRRFALLPYAKEILEDPEAKFIHQKRIIKGVVNDSWRFTASKDGLVIKVVVRQIEGGKKHFFSIYGKKQKQKSPPKSVDL